MSVILFPPELNSTQPAFYYDVVNYTIQFQLASTTTFEAIKHIQIKVEKQSNNSNMVDTNIYPDGIIYKPKIAITHVNNTNYYSIDISINDLAAKQWNPGELYKIQLRFGLNDLYTSKEDFANWKNNQITQSAFSEWSTVMIIKPISMPEIEIKNMAGIKEGVETTIKLETSLTPTFIGSCTFVYNEKEYVDKYRFILYNEQMELLEDSGYLQRNSQNGETDSYRFSTILQNNNKYIVIYSIISNNGFQISSLPYNFQIQQVFLSEIKNIDINIDNMSEYAKENGCIQIKLSSSDFITGNYVLVRTSEKSNYSILEDLKYFLFSGEKFDNNVIYNDYSIENGIKYKYAIQYENSGGLRTTPLFEIGEEPKSVFFEFNFLVENERQLPLRYNTTINTFKKTVLFSKNDTLGSRFPYITRNGQAYYTEFQLSGLISLLQDEIYIQQKEDGYYDDKKLIIPEHIYALEDIDTNLNDKNIYMEQKYRDRIEYFLNNGKPKLFRSPTEGNIIIVLTNISLSPEETLGRMIYNFSATAYEIAEFNLENLYKYNILNLGKFETFLADEETKLYGQLEGYFLNSDNLLDKIKEQVEYNIGGNYKYSLKQILNIWIEQYPKIDFTNEINMLEAEKKVNPDASVEIDKQIEKYKTLMENITSKPENNVLTLIINGKDFSIGKNRIYNLEDVFSSLYELRVKYDSPIILNYICSVVKVEDVSTTVQSIENSILWNQIHGIFTDNDDILSRYNYKYKDSVIYKIPKSDGTYDNINFNVYKTKNILDIIHQVTKQMIEKIYDTTLSQYIEETEEWTNGTLYLNFIDYLTVDIEAEEGTVIKIISKNDKEQNITIGSNNHYTLKPSSMLIKHIELVNPTFAIISFKVATQQTLKKIEVLRYA